MNDTNLFLFYRQRNYVKHIHKSNYKYASMCCVTANHALLGQVFNRASEGGQSPEQQIPPSLKTSANVGYLLLFQLYIIL